MNKSASIDNTSEQSTTDSQTTAIANDQKNNDDDGTLDSGSLFYLKRPKDVAEGVGQGVGNILKGALGGAALLVSAPIKGAYDGGHREGSWGALKGFGMGLGLGVLGGITMIVGGTVTGCYQIGRGIANTPSSFSARSEGKDWDDEKREWIYYNLQEEASIYMNMSDEEYLQSLHTSNTLDPPLASGDTNQQQQQQQQANNNNDTSKRPAKKVHDLEFYQILDVASNATPAEIKKAYYKKARDNHPDKHPNDPEAHAKFQAIGQAYQVLSDENLRANYDQHGKDGVEGSSKMDPSTLFAMIFGSEKFVPLVGELKLATQMQQANDNSSDNVNSNKLMKFRQRKREIQCALNLVQKLQSYIDLCASDEGFRAVLSDELNELTSSPFGSTLVSTIGTAYYEAAVAELSTLDSISVGFTQAGRSINTNMSIASAGVRAAIVANEVSKAQKLQQQQQQSVPSSSSSSDSEQGNHSQSESTKDGTSNSSSSSSSSSSSNDGEDDRSTKKQQQRDVNDASMKEKYERLSGHMFTVMWYVTEIDIQSTLKAVCIKVLHDHTVSATTRALRAKGLKVMGEYFLSKGGSLEAGLNDVKSKLQSQMSPEADASSSEHDHVTDTTVEKDSSSNTTTTSTNNAFQGSYSNNENID